MKFVFSFLFFCFNCCVFAQLPVDSVTSKVTYTEVVSIEAVSKDELYLKAREWFSLTFKSANNVIQMDDKQSGKLIGKGVDRVLVKVGSTVNDESLWFTLTIETKENKYRYELTNLYYKTKPNQYNGYASEDIPVEMYYGPKAYNKKGEMKPVFAKYIEATDAKAKELVSNLKSFMAKSASVKKDW